MAYLAPSGHRRGQAQLKEGFPGGGGNSAQGVLHVGMPESLGLQLLNLRLDGLCRPKSLLSGIKLLAGLF